MEKTHFGPESNFVACHRLLWPASTSLSIVTVNHCSCVCQFCCFSTGNMAVYCQASDTLSLLAMCGLQTVKAVKPNFTPDPKPGRIDYASPLLSTLNNSHAVLVLFRYYTIQPKYIMGCNRNRLCFFLIECNYVINSANT